jgi:hypothetical protein
VSDPARRRRLLAVVRMVVAVGVVLGVVVALSVLW